MQSGKGVVHLTELESGDYKSICENLYDGIHITDGTGTILFINKAYTRTTGILPEELLGRKVSEIEAEGILYTGSVTERVLAQGKRINSVATIHRLNKEVLVTGTPVFDEEKNIRLVVTNTRDFPELKRLEAQLLALEKKQEKAVQELAYLRSRQAGDKQTIYHSAAMREVMEIVRKVAPTDVTVLITGESGTGKELIANEIYQNSDRCGKPFIKLNCAAIPAELLESELFGYEEGAFTGAKRTGKAGMFELANTGVLLLDEVGDMPMALQAKLLRVLQERSLVRLGGSKTIDLDIRVIAATNKELLTQVRQGRFREDLYYRLNTVPIQVPPLRERPEDIVLLFRKFASDCAEKYRMPPIRLDDEARQLLVSYRWPGNVRELKNITERISVIEETRDITADVLRLYLPNVNVEKYPVLVKQDPDQKIFNSEREILYQVLFDMKKDVNELKKLVHDIMGGNIPMPTVADDTPYAHPIHPAAVHAMHPTIQDAEDVEEETLSLEEVEKEMIRKALEKHNGRRKNAAADLKISERTLYRKIKEYNLE